jgi:hypothetical protein
MQPADEPAVTAWLGAHESNVRISRVVDYEIVNPPASQINGL